MQRKILFTFILTILLILSVEIVLGYLLWLRQSEIPSPTWAILRQLRSRFSDESEVKVTFLPSNIRNADEYLGYAMPPGKYQISMLHKPSSRLHQWQMTLDENGNRMTSKTPEIFNGKPSIWIFGDSVVFGYGHNDETSLPFFLQQMLYEYQVVNYAFGGYGNVQAYLQLKRAIKTRVPAPVVIVVGYADYFNVRNVAAPSFLMSQFSSPGRKSFGEIKYKYPKAVIDKDNELRIEYVQMDLESSNFDRSKDPPRAYQFMITKRILKEIHKLGRDVDAKMILVFIQGTDDDEVVSFASDIGYIISDIRPNDQINERDNLLPFDAHPGPLAHNIYARKLYRTIVHGEDPRARKWRLRTYEGNIAELLFPPEHSEIVRVEIYKTKTDVPWHIQLNQPQHTVEADGHYAVRFRARADRPRQMVVAFAENHPPWMALGFRKTVQLTTEWQTFDEAFVATVADDNARIHFDLGGSNISVEVSDVVLRSLPAGR